MKTFTSSFLSEKLFSKITPSLLIVTLLGANNLHAGTIRSGTTFFVKTSASQAVPIEGKVTDEKGNGLPGITILIKGTSSGTTTDADGKFALAVPDENAVLVLSYIGYKTKEVSVGKQKNLSIALEPDTKQLSEIVIVGYGTQERKNLIGSVTKVNPAETKSIPTGSFDAQLQGQAAGLQINSNTGVPGDGIFIRVRGTTSINAGNDPLYVVDGVFINNTSLQTVNTGGRATSPIADINPADIESIEVLKDASATAIYGSRGANGVVIVTTKRGNYNAKPQLNFNHSQGWAWAPENRLWKLTTGPQHAELINEYWVNSGIDNPALKQTYENRPFRPKSEGGRGLPEEQNTYDRLHELFRTGRVANYDLSLNGGSKATKYYIGGGYTRQEANIKPIYFERASFKVNLDQQINDKVQIGVSNTLSRSFRNQARAGDGPQGGLLQSALHTPTYLPEYNEDSTPARWAGFDNLKVLLDNYDVNTVSLRYIGNLYADIELLPGLKLHSSFGIDYNHYDESEYWNDKTQLGASPTNGLATSSLTQNSTWLNEQTLSYRKSFGTQHTFGALIGNSLQSNVQNNTAAQGSGFPSNSYKQISSASTRTSSQSWTKSTLASFFGRVDYNYASKYFIELSVRADGSSRFGANNRWGYFPAIGAAWRIKEESFLKDIEFISDLKLRGSYGITGNQNGINNFAARGLWSGEGGYPDNTTGGDLAGTAPQQLGNPNLRWEKTRQFNAGLDLGLLNGRIGVEFNVYSKYTTDVLLEEPVPAITGFNSYYSNIGEISNKGYELAITSENIRKGDFSWRTSFNISGNVNKIEKLPVPINMYNRNWVRMEQGHSMYSFWLYKQEYVDTQTGQAVFQDVNTDGSITASDRQIIGNAVPKFFGGVSNTITYKGFDAGIIFSYQYGNKVFNLNRFFGEGGGTRDANRVLFASQLKRWQKPGDVTDVPRLTSVGNNYKLEQNSRFLEDGSFLKLSTVTVGYTLPKELTTRVRIEKLRLYVTGSNLFIVTKYTGADPESNVTSSQTVQGLDLGTPPQPRSIQVGVNVTL
ncbi:TonB-dependent receptor [Xanthocytophaga agilis]|uniref:TonB-dependent receptor n=1 Tax=Xanthocytophaga agilis TaxID=3048010 RepID=A0AAE3RD08_9BACT|nr:TonB-dependent receptor [Xanthocytophaga agilis]MDJ1506244.1 TonB-dependent receptor [Xanthocytophaga agilis]